MKNFLSVHSSNCEDIDLIRKYVRQLQNEAFDKENENISLSRMIIRILLNYINEHPLDKGR